MTSQWSLSGFDFTIACELAGRDTVPYPLSFPSRRMGGAEYRVKRNAAAERVHGMDPDFFTALRVLARPDLRIALDGDASGRRVCAYIAESGGFTAVAMVNPAGDGVDVRLGTAGSVHAAVGCLPAAVPGRHRLLPGPSSSTTIEELIATARAKGSISAARHHHGHWLGGFRWIEAPDGRYVVTESDGWTTIVPASNEAIRSELSLLVRGAVIDSHG